MMKLVKVGFMVCYKLPMTFSLVLASLCFFSGVVAGADKVPFSRNDTISEIRDKIVANGYQFTVADNWVTHLPLAERRKILSRHAPFTPTFRSANVDPGPLVVRLSGSLPSSFDWRDFQGHSYIGPVRDQGGCGSCYAFGACAAAEGVYNVALGKYDLDCLDLSEAFLAFCLDHYYDGYEGCLGSDYDYQELDALVERGVCLEVDYPYSGVDEGCGLGSKEAARAKFDGWYRVPCGDIIAIKSAIMAYGVVAGAVFVTSAFEAYQSGIFSDSLTECSYTPCYYTSTNHCIALVGWQDTGLDGDGYWILRNSWGSSWGEDGYMRIAYRSAHVACEVCYMVYTGSEVNSSKNSFVNYDGFCDGASPCFSTVSAAYAAAGSDAEIKVRSGYCFCENGVVFNLEKNVSLSGGWNEDYSDDSLFTYLFGGSLQIKRGCVVANRLILGDATSLCRNEDSAKDFASVFFTDSTF